MTIYTDNRMLAAGLVGGTLSRHTGDMKEIASQETIYKQLGIPPGQILHFHQTHSDTLCTVSNARDAATYQNTALRDADAWLFTTPGVGGAILTADCVPLFLWDEGARALYQAGARAAVQGWLGPHIQDCCFEVQEDVACQFSAPSVRRKNGKIFVNLNVEILRQLEEAGVNPLQVKTPYYCTCGDKENFFSWRRDRVRAHLLSFIYKPGTLA